MKTYGLASTVASRIRDAVDWSALSPNRFTHQESLQCGFVKGWVGPTSGLVIVLALPVIEPRLLRRPTCNHVNIPYILVKQSDAKSISERRC